MNQLTVLGDNTPPRASFTISLTSGTTSTIFEFDASDSWDDQDSTLLDFRWDWEDDDIWDTEYTSIHTATHQYSEEGKKTIRLEAKDSGGLTNSITQQVIVNDEPFTDTTITDIDGNIYKIVKIGEQYWMAENLRVTRYRNGDSITLITDNNEWKNTTSGAYCVYGNTDDFISSYGFLYNWYAIDDERNISPEGWHIPTEAEWNTLFNSLGGYEIAGGKMKETGTSHWNSPNSGATNESGFSARGGGRRWRDGPFMDLKVSADFWQKNVDWGFSWGLYNQNTHISGTWRFNVEGISIRCVKD